VREARVSASQVAGLFLVGGATRVPLVATLLHRALGIAPTTLEQPEVVVAAGAADVPAGQVLSTAPVGGPVGGTPFEAQFEAQFAAQVDAPAVVPQSPAAPPMVPAAPLSATPGPTSPPTAACTWRTPRAPPPGAA
jgi:hypothetical protein